MKLGIPTINNLVILVTGNEDTVTRIQYTPNYSGRQIVSVFSKLGFRNDDYDFDQGGFIVDGEPKKISRSAYAKDRINKINDTPQILELISSTLSSDRFKESNFNSNVAAEYLNEELKKDRYQVSIQDGNVFFQEGNFDIKGSVTTLEIIPITLQDSGIHNISEYTSTRIIDQIRHFGRTMEASPTTYKKLTEEELRNIFLAHLNGTYKGIAKGEVFRNQGKTDICIEAEDRSAFVAEFKVWHGKNQASTALEQLLDYLIWRDSHASLIFFNKEIKEFHTLIPKLENSIANHKLTIKEITNEQKAEWSFLVHPENNIDHQIKLHMFLFNIYSS